LHRRRAIGKPINPMPSTATRNGVEATDAAAVVVVAAVDRVTPLIVVELQ